MTTPQLRKSTGRSPWRLGFFLNAFMLVAIALSPTAKAVSPPPDGGYANANTAEGGNALFSLTTGAQNTAIGNLALFSNTTGSFNTANGSGTLEFNTTGNSNTANGNGALLSNTTADENTAIGAQTLQFNTTGADNTATGFQALYGNTTGGGDTATGAYALISNTTGNRNTAIGGSSLPANTTGFRNTGAGFASLFNNSTGNLNTATGWSSLFNNSTGSFNIALGYKAGENLTTGDNNIDVGSLGGAGDANTVRIGNQVAGTDDVGFPHPAHTATYIAGIANTTLTTNTAPVVVDTTTGQLGHAMATSSQRFKDDIKPMAKASEAILSLKPVTFHYKQEFDPTRSPQFGLVAEEVEKINPDLVTRGHDGKAYGVRYEAVNAMLLNEFLKEHRKVEDLKSTVAKQEKQIEALTTGLQKVSAQVEMNKPTPKVVANQ